LVDEGRVRLCERHDGVRAARLLRVETRRDERRLRVAALVVKVLRSLLHKFWPLSVQKNLPDDMKGKNGAARGCFEVGKQSPGRKIQAAEFTRKATKK
jgi:hypothetical protein